MTMTIGDFSRATRLTAKTLRFYHQVKLLEPARVDPMNGYRLYAVEQIAAAQMIRQFRALDMPVDLIRDVLASDVGARDQLIAGHLARMEAELEATRSVVASLRQLLAPAETPLEVSHRHVGETAALVIRETIDLADLGPWYTAATKELEESVKGGGVEVVGARGGIWATELFLHERGEAALFRPFTSSGGLPAAAARVRAETLPAVDLAVAVHHGSDDTLALVYGALGEYVTRRGLSVAGPIREIYLQESSPSDGYALTEIGWPISGASR